MSLRRRTFTSVSIILIGTVLLGCEVRLKPIVHTVEYRSDVACVPNPEDCPWSRLEQEAKFSSLVNCILAGSTVLRTKTSDQDAKNEKHILASTPPRYGYEHVTADGEGKGKRCPSEESVCMVASRFDRKLTWAGCGTQPLEKGVLRGGEEMTSADRLSGSAIVTGSLAESTNGFIPLQGMDGPDQFYTFTLWKTTRVETAVGANSSDFSPTQGHQAPWQPALFLLAADGRKVSEGHVWRAGVTSLFPIELDPGTYYLVVDSSKKEFLRGDGLYNLYFGLNQHHLGPLDPS